MKCAHVTCHQCEDEQVHSLRKTVIQVHDQYMAMHALLREAVDKTNDPDFRRRATAALEKKPL